MAARGQVATTGGVETDVFPARCDPSRLPAAGGRASCWLLPPVKQHSRWKLAQSRINVPPAGVCVLASANCRDMLGNKSSFKCLERELGLGSERMREGHIKARETGLHTFFFPPFFFFNVAGEVLQDD